MTTENSEDDFKVGYKRPPQHSQFQPGSSGNPGGKQKAVRNLGSDVKRTLEAPVRLNEQGKARRVSLAESGGSKCKEAPNEGPFRETLGCLARAGGGAP